MIKNNIKLTLIEEFWMVAFLLAARKISYNDVSSLEFKKLFNEKVIKRYSEDPTCKAICDLIVDRTFNFEVADNLDIWSVYGNVTDKRWDGINLGRENSSLWPLSEGRMAEIIVKFCKMFEIYWDDTNKTPEEMEAYTNTWLGGKLWDYECFISQNLE